MTSSEGQAGRPTGLASLFPDRSALEQRWGREPLLVRAGERPSGEALLDIDAVDELLSTRGLRTPFVRVAKGGRTLPDRAFTRPAGVGATIGDQVADDDLLRLFAEGHTIVLQALHRTWEPVRALVAALADDLGHPVQANAYVTPPQSTGFSAHYDVHDVFVLQVSGEKRWRIHAPVHEHPLRSQPWGERADAVAERAEQEPYLEATLAPGDLLYLPRGWLHSATALGGVSTHLTLGIHTWHGEHVLDEVLATVRDGLRADPAARRSLPLGVDLADPRSYDGRIDAVRSVLERALADLDEQAVADRLASRARSGRAAPVAPVRSVEALAALEADPGAWRLELRDHLGAELRDGVLRSRVGRLTVSEADAQPLARLLTDGSVTVSDIGADLARRLVVAGLATPAPAPSRLDGS